MTTFFLAVAALLIFTIPSVASSQTGSFFVSPSGDDENPGTQKRPFATIERAQAATRHMRVRGGVTVFLRGGTYYLPKPLLFTPEDSGTETAPVVYRAYERETPILSGAVRLSLHWTPFKNGIFQAKLPENEKSLAIDALFCNGQLQHMARYPNFDPTARYFDGVSADAISPDRVKRWANPAGGFIHGLHSNEWGSLHYRILGSNPDGTLRTEGGWQHNQFRPMSRSILFVENIFEELDTPGEWYLDKTQGVLYLMPMPGVNLAHARVEAAVQPSLIEFQGSESSPVRWISLQGLTFTQTTRTFMETKEPLLRSDWCIYRGGAAFLTGTENCRIQNCDFTDVGGNAVFVSNYNRRAAITGCKIVDAGASGICFVGDPAAVRSPLFNYSQSQPETMIDPVPGPKTGNYPAECAASDNLITRTGRIEIQTAGVEIDMAQDITVSHCSIYDVPRSGINIGDGCWGGHIIEYCDVFDTVKESGDHGSFNSWGRDRYWNPDRGTMEHVVADHPDWFRLDAIKPIVLRNSRWVCHHGWDIDLDDGSSNYLIINNLCLGGGIKNREGGFRDVENNVIPANGFHPHVWFRDSQDVFTRNIFAQGYHPAGQFASWWGKRLDSNFFLNPEDLRTAQTTGHDVQSLAGDPLFVDPSRGDYRVKDGSPALQIGFKNFPMDDFGVVSPRLRAQAKNGFDFAAGKERLETGPARDATKRVWHGATVKNVTELGERSAAGLPGILGVLVLAVPTGSGAAQAGLLPDDVVWMLNGAAAPDYATLLKIEGSAAGTASLLVQVYRNQQLVTLRLPSERSVP